MEVIPKILNVNQDNIRNFKGNDFQGLYMGFPKETIILCAENAITTSRSFVL